jgi:hypothetical protein
MTSATRLILDSTQRMWSAMTGRTGKRSADRIQDVIVHDPAAQEPKNLDNPLHDAAAQGRVGDMIARATRDARHKAPT